MTGNEAVYRRVLRRETHASRTGPAVLVAVVLALVFLCGIVIGISAIVDPELRRIGATAANSAVTVLRESPPWLVPSGALLLALGMVLIALALLPGRRSRRARVGPRAGVLVDLSVLADAVADRVSARCGIERSQLDVTVTRWSTRVRVTPTSGVPIDESVVRETAHESLAEIGFATPIRVAVERKGVVA